MDYNYNYNYDYNYYNTPTTATFALTGGLLIVYVIFMLALSVFLIACQWKIFTKAGEKGWKSLIPIYNLYILLKIAELPGWYLLLYIIPGANLYAIFKHYIELAKRFGKDAGFGVLMVFFNIICLPILAFGKATYTPKNSMANDTYQNTNQNFNGQNMYAGVQNPTITNYDANTVSFQNPAVNVQNTNPNIETFTSPVQPVQEPHNNLQPEEKVYSPDNLDRTVYIKKFCPNCGNNLEPGQQFCGNCGNKL